MFIKDIKFLIIIFLPAVTFASRSIFLEGKSGEKYEVKAAFKFVIHFENEVTQASIFTRNNVDGVFCMGNQKSIKDQYHIINRNNNGFREFSLNLENNPEMVKRLINRSPIYCNLIGKNSIDQNEILSFSLHYPIYEDDIIINKVQDFKQNIREKFENKTSNCFDLSGIIIIMVLFLFLFAVFIPVIVFLMNYLRVQKKLPVVG